MKSKSRVARSQEEIRAAILTAAKEYISRYGVAKTTVAALTGKVIALSLSNFFNLNGLNLRMRKILLIT